MKCSLLSNYPGPLAHLWLLWELVGIPTFHGFLWGSLTTEPRLLCAHGASTDPIPQSLKMIELVERLGGPTLSSFMWTLTSLALQYLPCAHLKIKHESISVDNFLHSVYCFSYKRNVTQQISRI